MSRIRRVNRSALVPFSAESMFALVADVPSYPEFLPWCTSAHVRSETDVEQEAAIGIGLGALHTEFATRNRLSPPTAMHLQLLDGPFSQLSGDWRFEEVGGDSCEVSLQLEFSFASRVQDGLFGTLFERVCNELIDAFVRRAHDLYDGQ